MIEPVYCPEFGHEMEQWTEVQEIDTGVPLKLTSRAKVFHARCPVDSWHKGYGFVHPGLLGQGGGLPIYRHTDHTHFVYYAMQTCDWRRESIASFLSYCPDPSRPLSRTEQPYECTGYVYSLRKVAEQ